MSTVAELMVRILADASQLTKGMVESSSSIGQHQKAVKILDSEYKALAQSVSGAENKEQVYAQMVQKLTEKQEMQKKVVSSLAAELQKTAKEKGQDDKSTQQLTLQLTRAQEAQAKFAAEIRRTNQAMETARKQARDYSKDLATVDSAMDTLGTGFMIIGGAATAGFGAAIRQGVILSAQMEQTKIAFTTMLGSAQAADAFVQQLWDFAAKTPFEFTGLQDSTKLLMAYGFQAKDIIPTMTAIGNAASGLGGGQEKIDRIITAIGQMRAKSIVSAEEMRQLAEAGIPAWEILARKIGVSVPEAMKMAEQRSIPAAQGIEALIEGMNQKFPDMMKKQSESTIGLWSTVKDFVSGTLRDMGDEATRAFDLKNKMKEAIAWMEQFKKSGDLAVWGQRVGTVLNGVVAGVKFLADHWKGLGSLAAGVLAGFMAYKTITGVINAVKVAQAALNLVMAANPIAIVVLAVAALAAGLIYLYNTNETARFYILKAWKAIVMGVAEYVNFMMQALAKVWGWIPVLGDKLKAAADVTQGWADKSVKAFKETTKESMLAKEAAEREAKAKATAAAAAKQKADAEALAAIQTKQATGANNDLANSAKSVADKTKEAADKIKEVVDRINEFVGQVKDRISTEVSIIKTQYDIWTLSAGKTATESQKLAEQIKTLTQEAKVHQDRIGQLNKAYNQMAALKGVTSIEARKLYSDLLNEKKAWLEVGAAIEDATKKMNELSKAMPWGGAFQGGEFAGKTLQDIIDDAEYAKFRQQYQSTGTVNTGSSQVVPMSSNNVTNVNFNGDVYGMDDFKEKVTNITSSATKQNRLAVLGSY